MDKYQWLPSESAHQSYPVQIVKGDFIFKDRSSIYLPAGKVVNNGWGKIGSTHLVGDKLKPLPYEIKLSWFSYTEDKFYAGDFMLPFEKIKNLFKAGVVSPSTGQKITYETIIVGLAPGGAVSVWLETEGVVLEVATFQASEAKLDWKLVLDNEDVSREDYIRMVLEEALGLDGFATLKSKGVPGNLSEVYRKQYDWAPEVAGAKLLALKLKTNNGEYETFTSLVGPRDRVNRAVPKVIYLDWQDAHGAKFTFEAKFSEREAIQAYDKLCGGKDNVKMKLLLEISQKTHDLDISLKSQHYFLKLENVTVKVNSL